VWRVSITTVERGRNEFKPCGLTLFSGCGRVSHDEILEFLGWQLPYPASGVFQRRQRGNCCGNADNYGDVIEPVSRKTAACMRKTGSEPGGTRTHDPLIKSQLLCQLSYGLAQSLLKRPA
jgi:hypothetical protein